MARLREPPVLSAAEGGWEVDLTRGVVQLLTARGGPAGSGFLVTDRLLVTCAHVVSGSGRGAEPPADPVTVVFPHLDAAPRTARVELALWRGADAGDVAFLRLADAPPAGAEPLPLGASAGAGGHPVKAFGFPVNAPGAGHYGYGVLGDRVRADSGAPLLQVTDSTEMTEGFSGGPLLDGLTGLVIGMVDAVARPDRLGRGQSTAYVTPTETLREVCPQLAVSEVCPYRGLEPFTYADADWFRGRDRAVDAVLASLRRDRRFLALLGPSGSGKSSLVHAGVLPALDRGAIPGSDRWGWISARPAVDPYAQLEQAGLAGAAQGLVGAARRWLDERPEYERLVLVLDQFEELLVATPPSPRAALLEQLARLPDEEPAVTTILVFRDDFYSRLAAAAPPLMRRLVEQASLNVPAVLEPDELTAIVERPAALAGPALEPELAKRIAGDAMVAAAPPDGTVTTGAAITVLPLLEFALTELWLRREDGRLTHRAYEQIGGVVGGLARWCDQAYAALPLAQRLLVRQILTSLVRPGDDTANIPPTRQRRTLAEFSSGKAEAARDAVAEVIAALTARRLLVTGRDPVGGEATVELVHLAFRTSPGSFAPPSVVVLDDLE